MKWMTIIAVWSLAAVAAWAQPAWTAEEEALGEVPIELTDTEAASLVQTIKGYVQGATHRGHLELFDRRKGDTVTLRLEQVVLDDPSCIVFPADDRVAICGECIRVTPFVDENEEKQWEDTRDRYVVWFLVQRGGMATSRVLDVYIKAVNDFPMYNWTQNKEGVWEATLVPEERL